MEQTSDVRLKLLIDKKSQKVLYGEADKKFIDFLFNLLSNRLGAVIKLLNKDGMVGCMGNLYESVEPLNEAYLLQPSQSKVALLEPEILPDVGVPVAAKPARLYTCSNNMSFFVDTCRGYVSYIYNETCPGCDEYMREEYTVVPILPKRASARHQPAQEGGGFVKDLATYIVTDDLTVQHISYFSITTLFRKFNVQGVDSLEKEVITLDVDEGVEILEASLQWKTGLTHALLKRRRTHTIDNSDVIKLSNAVVKRTI